jgi:hypothetical protein
VGDDDDVGFQALRWVDGEGGDAGKRERTSNIERPTSKVERGRI